MTDFLLFVVAGLVSGAIYALAAMGIVFTYQVSRVVNFAYGGIGMFCAYSYWQMRIEWAWPAFISLPLAVLVLPTILALLSERFVYRRLATASLFAKTAASIGVLLAFYGLSLYFWTSPIQLQTLQPPAIFSTVSTFHLPGVVVSYNQLGIFLSALVIVVLLFAYLRFTPSGVRLRAVVVNRDLAELRGIDTTQTTRLAWVVSYVLAAVAGVLLASFTGNDPLTLTLVVVYALAAAVLGRLMSLPWAVFGGLLLGLGDSFLLGYLPQGQFITQVRLALPFAFLLVALVIFARKLATTTHGESRTALMADLASAAFDRRVHVRELFTRLVPIIVVIAILQAIQDDYALTLVSSGVAYGIIFLSYRVFTATTGLVSLAQAAFAGTGAFVAADLATSSWHVPWGLAVVGAAVVCGGAGALVAIPTVRLRGIFLVIATMAFAQLVTSVVFSSQSFTGGIDGKTFPRPDGFGGTFAYLILLLVLFVVLALLCEVFQYSVTGRELQADLGSPIAARSIGLRPEVGRLIAFVISAGLAGVGGALLASQVQVVAPDSWDLIPPAFLWFVLVASGGLGSSSLMLQMGIVSTVLPALINAWVPSLNNAYIAIFGVLGLIALRIPGGTAGIEQRMADRVRRLRKRGTPVVSAEVAEDTLVG
jgi:branched-subunit amino acid ABC-type transport system permease component